MIKGEHLKAQEELLKQVGEKINVIGFSPKPSGQSFYRIFSAEKWAFHISFIRHKSDLDCTADIAICNNEIENLVNRYDTKLTAKEKRGAMTLGEELERVS